VKFPLASLSRIAPPRDGAVHLWPVAGPASADPLADFVEHLTPAEVERGDRYRDARRRHEFFHYRLALRRCLAAYVGAAPREIPLRLNDQGKPLWSEPIAGVQLAFSVSHKKTRAVIAVSSLSCVGVDLEEVDDRTRWSALFRESLSADEYLELLQLAGTQQVDTFLKIWTCKEAFLKAVGCGMTRPLPTLQVKYASSLRPLLVRTGCSTEQAAAWKLMSWSLWPGWWVAIAAPEPSERWEVEMVHGLDSEVAAAQGMPG
jgi:4'-phosphopantetheinyl transferase